METITPPKNLRYDITCGNIACGAVLRCEASDLTHSLSKDPLLSTFQINCGQSVRSANWLMQCPHCKAITTLYENDMAKAVRA